MLGRHSLVALITAILSPAIRADDAGIVLIFGDGPKPLRITLPSHTAFQFVYDPSRLAVYADPQFDFYVPSRHDFTTAALPADPVPHLPLPQAETSGPSAFAPLSDVYLCAVGKPSDTLGDVVLNLMTDPDGDGVLQIQNSFSMTAVQMTAPDAKLRLGSVFSVSIRPALAPLAFSADTTATWSGTYVGFDSFATEPLVAWFSKRAVHETGPATADLVVGEGLLVSGNPGQPALGGHLSGRLEFRFPGVEGSVGRWFSCVVDPSYTYVAGAGGAGGETPQPDLLDPSEPGWEGLDLENAVAGHTLLTLLVSRNSYTEKVAPKSIDIDLVSKRASGAELDRVSLRCYLEQERGNDFGPDLLVYYSDWERPIVFVTTPVDDRLHSTLKVLQVDPAGSFYPLFGHRVQKP